MLTTSFDVCIVLSRHNLETLFQFQLDLTENFSFQIHETTNVNKLVAGTEDPKQSY